jgi:hypothetical protein
MGRVKTLTRFAIHNTLSFLTAMVLSGFSGAAPETNVPMSDLTATTAAGSTLAFPTATIQAGGWEIYQNPQAGYRAEYPADWTVSEQVGQEGTIVTTFSPPDSSAGVIVMVQSGEFGAAGSSDIPNTRCEEIQVGGLTGTRCFDTINMAASTTFVANAKTYTIAALGKRLDESLYDRFVSSFQVVK